MREHLYNAEYKAEVSKYKKKDAIIALCFYAFFYCVILFLPSVWGVLDIGPTEILGVNTVFIVDSIILIAAVFILVSLKKDGIASLGFRKNNLWPAVRLGLLFGSIILASVVLPSIIFGWETRAFGIASLMMFRTIIAAAQEDIIFVGYIQTRLYGLVKNDILAILVGAFLFSFMHLMPLFGSQGLAAFNLGSLIWMLQLIPAHIFHNAIFRRYFSILPVIIVHALGNGAQHFWYSYGAPGAVLSAYVGIIAVLFALVTWVVCLRRRGGKVQDVRESSVF